MDRDKLLTAFKKAKRLLIKSPKITSTVFLIIIFSVVSVFVQDSNLEDNSEIVELRITPTPTLIPTPTIIIATPGPTIIVKKEEVSQSAFSNSNTVISPLPPSPITAIANTSQGNESLLNAVNEFRSVNGVSSLSSSGTLCQIAEKRLKELIEKGGLDGHEGFNKYFSSQTEFNSMGEVIFQSSNQQSAKYAVNEGWAKSTAGHRENLLDAKWNFGCGATNGYFFIFNLGKK